MHFAATDIETTWRIQLLAGISIYYESYGHVSIMFFDMARYGVAVEIQ